MIKPGRERMRAPEGKAGGLKVSGNGSETAIVTPFLDGALVGGASIIGLGLGLAFVLLLGGEFGQFKKSDWLVLAILVNAPHFMASYRLLYASAEQIRKSPWASIYVPVVLLGLLGYRMFGPGGDTLAQVILIIGALYLAVHYTGQAWGMVASFSHLAGVRFDADEQNAIRAGMRVLLVLHLMIAVQGRHPPSRWISRTQYTELYDSLFAGLCVLAALTLLVGAAGFWRAHARTQAVPVRAVLPWLSLYFWYPAWMLLPGGPFWVQLSHALQYLAFPLRVEANRFRARSGGAGASVFPHMALVYVVLVVAGVVFLKGPPLTTRAIGPGWYSELWMRQAFETFVLLINIHHFFIDGALWKLRNPEVRQELFAHISARGD